MTAPSTVPVPFPSRSGAAPGGRFLVVKGSGGAGLGDKVRAVISAIVYARLSGRTLYVDWNDPAYGDGEGNYFDALFSLVGIETTSERPAGGCVRPPVWQDKLHLSWDRLYAEQGTPPWNRSMAMQMYSFDQGVLDWPEDVCVMWDFDQFPKLRPYLPSLYASIRGHESQEWQQGEVLRRHLVPGVAVREGMHPYLQRLETSRPCVGVHVRAADEHFRLRAALPVSAYVKAVRTIMRRSGARTLFLATDNADVQELFAAEFGREHVLWTEKWLPEAGVALHLANACPDRQQSARDALLDILLLASADYLVTAGTSSFSILARLFSTVPEQRRVTLMWKCPLWKRVWRRLGWSSE